MIKTYTLREVAYLLNNKWSHMTIRTAARQLADAGEIRKREHFERWKLTAQEALKVKRWLTGGREATKRETWTLKDVADTLGATRVKVASAARTLVSTGKIRERTHSAPWALTVEEVILIKQLLEAQHERIARIAVRVSGVAGQKD